MSLVPRICRSVPPPVYDSCDTNFCFSFCMHHGGFFVGSTINLGYVDGQEVWVDNVAGNLWCFKDIEEIVEGLGYEMTGRMHVYFCLLGKEMNKGGLVEMKSDEECKLMRSHVICGHNFLHIYLDQEKSLGKLIDDVLLFPIAELPPVISPKKTTYLKPVKEHVSPFYKKLPKGDVDEYNSSDDSDYDELVDSDYDIRDGDEDLQDDHVPLGKGEGKEVAEPEADLEEDELQLPDSDSEDEDRTSHMFKSFMPEDMLNPMFQIGQVFQSPEMLRKAIREYSCKNIVDISLPVNDMQRISAKCEDGCPWSIWASYDSRTKCFVIKRHNDEHTCSKQWKIRAFTSRFLSEKYIEKFRANENMNLRDFSRTVQLEWSMTPSRSKLSRARRMATKKIYGDEVGQYNLLWDYANEMRRSNPGSTFFISVDNEVWRTVAHSSGHGPK